jgi:hypothetical protein
MRLALGAAAARLDREHLGLALGVARSSAALIRSLPSSTVIEWVVAVAWALRAMNGSKASASSIDSRLRSVISRSMGLSRWARATDGGTGRSQFASSGSG